MSIREISFPSANGRDTIKAWSYSPLGKPKAIVQLIHGYGEHSRRYLHMISKFNEAGFVVFADDHLGHGKTGYDGGTLGDPHSGGYMTYLKDEKALHDIAKDLNKDLEKNMMLRFYKEYCDYPEVCYHQFLGEYLVKNLFLITDKDTLEAIKYHTTGKKEMTTLGKIIYAADKIEPTRGYDSSAMIDMMEKDVDEGFIEVLKENRKYYNEKNFFVNTPLQLECFKYYLK